jgi:hypothetical protein
MTALAAGPFINKAREEEPECLKPKDAVRSNQARGPSHADAVSGEPGHPFGESGGRGHPSLAVLGSAAVLSTMQNQAALDHVGMA